MEAISSKVLVGIGGWEHESFDGLFYPAQAADSLHRLSLLASAFDFTEVRASFWDDSLSARDATEWAAAPEGNRRFRFVVKLHRSFTHKRTLRLRRTQRMRQACFTTSPNANGWGDC